MPPPSAAPAAPRLAGMSRPKLLVRVLSVLAILYVLRLIYTHSSKAGPTDIADGDGFFKQPQPQSQSQSPPRKALVVASLAGDDTSWLDEHLADWERYVYVVDDAGANLTVPRNKGRESNAYLTFLIDHYANLPDYMVFLHALRYQWHNEDPMYGESTLPFFTALSKVCLWNLNFLGSTNSNVCAGNTVGCSICNHRCQMK